jgi:predicted phage terminase large subunit-like protein
MTNSQKQMLCALLRTDLASFINKVFTSLNPGSNYDHNWHIDLIADYLSAVSKGQITRLIINIPPRCLKSIAVTVAWPAWILGHDPSKRIIAASFANSLSTKHSLDCKSIIQAPWYKELFPQTILSKKHNQKSKYLTIQNGFRMATSVGGMITGEGGDILIIDDPHNPSHIYSNKRRSKVIEWFESSFASRLNNKKSGSIVLVMQRLHMDDLAGYLLSSAPDIWQLLKIPLIAEENKIYQIMGKTYSQEEGEILHRARYSEEILVKTENEMGRSNFRAQYMQEPISDNISMLKPPEIAFYDELDVAMSYLVQSWDTAIKTSNSSDYSVCTIWGVKEGSYYLLHMHRAKLSYPELKNQAIKLTNRYKPKFILIEDHASGQSLIQDLRSEGMMNLIGIKQKIDKITRFAAVVGLFQSGVVKIPKHSTWVKPFIKELTEFPHSKHDDIVDSVTQFLGYMKGKTIRASSARVRVV